MRESGRVPALDGLRGLACLAVVASHVQVPYGSGGWLGVDVFFVLSGYLITGLLLTEREVRGRIDLLRFYGLRAARLYPALALTVAACAALPGLFGDRGHGYGLTALLALT